MFLTLPSTHYLVSVFFYIKFIKMKEEILCLKYSFLNYDVLHMCYINAEVNDNSDIAKRMLMQGKATTDIADITELSLATVKKLQADMLQPA